MSATAPVLQFDEATHTYTINGVVLPSITQVIQEAGLSGSFYPPESAERGTVVHLACEVYDMGVEPDEVDAEIEGYLAAWKKFRTDTGFTPDLIEHMAYHPLYRYAGRIDRTGTTNRAGKVLVELKSGAAEPWHRIQLAAQSALLESPTSYSRWAVYLHDDGTFGIDVFPLQDWTSEIHVFLNCLGLVNWKRKYYRMESR